MIEPQLPLGNGPAGDLVDQAAAEPLGNIISKAEFARLNGWAKSYVSKLVGEGRLVLTEDGKVLVAESLERIQATTGAPERASQPAVATTLQDLQAQEKRLDILRKEREEREARGELLQAADVLAVVADASVRLRSRLESWPDRLAPQLAAMGGHEIRIRAMLAEHVDMVLADLSQRMAKLAEMAGEGKPS